MTRIVVRSSGPDTTGMGMAVLVDPSHVITCAHVLRDAGYVPSGLTENGTTSLVQLTINGEQSAAKLLPSPWLNVENAKFPDDNNLPMAQDVAVLRLGEPRKDGAATLRKQKKDKPELFKTFGITAQRPHGIEATGSLASIADERGVVQMNRSQESPIIEKGFSGSPVLAPEDNYVLGIVVSRYLPQSGEQFGTPLAYMVPIDRIAKLLRESLGLVLQVDSPLFRDYPATRELQNWCVEELQRGQGVTGHRNFLHLDVLTAKNGRLEFDAIEQLHSGALSPTYFNALQPESIVAKEREFLYLQAPGGSGKSFLLYQLALAAIDAEVVPFFADVRRLLQSKATETEIKAKLSGQYEEALDAFLTLTAPYAGINKFKEAIANQRPALLVVDGLNETTRAFDEIVKLLQRIFADSNRMSIVVADRMTLREYPQGFQLATVEPVSDKDIEKAIGGCGLPAPAANPEIRALLRLPFFWDLFIQDPAAFASGKRGDIVLKYIQRSLTSDSNSKAADAGVSALVDDLCRIAFDWYGEYVNTVIERPALEQLAGASKELVDRLTGSGLLVKRSGKDGESLEFRHQLIHDYLAARWLVTKKLDLLGENFRKLTLDRQSTDALVFARELISAERGPEAGEQFVVKVYDWDYPSALSCIQATEGTDMGAVETAICALVAEKLYETFLNSRQRAESRLSLIKKGLRTKQLPTTIDELIEQVKSIGLNRPSQRFESWRSLFVKTGTADQATLEKLVQADPLEGWTAANVLRRVKLEEAQIDKLKLLLEFSKPDDSEKIENVRAAGKNTVVRWRIFHVLGSLYNQVCIDILREAAWAEREHPDARYGAARSLVELASRAPSELECGAILNDIAGRMGKIAEIPASEALPDMARSLKPYRNCAILKRYKSAEPLWWQKLYAPILEVGTKLFRDDKTEQALWKSQLERFQRDDREI